jgi:hypothetical protein
MYALRPQRPKPDSLIHVTRGHQGRSSRMIRRSTLHIVGIISSIPRSKKRRDRSVDLLM